MTAPRALADVIDSATGRAHRNDPALARSGGPAGNAQLTAWMGLVLLVLFLAELVTLLDVRGLISWHVAIGALAKTGTTTWRILRYYTGSAPYQQAGPPPLLLRLLGPLVVLTTLALLGTGIALVAFGPDSSSTPIVTVAGRDVTAVTLHQASFLAWAVATGLHVLTRTVPAIRLTAAHPSAGQVAGIVPRAVILTATVALAAAVAAITLSLAGSWVTGFAVFHHRPHAAPFDRPAGSAGAHGRDRRPR
jgi:hypothetical protein